jgi:hypothetical protein
VSSIGNSILGRDLARLAQSSDAPKLIGRPNTDPDFQAEANFFLANGMSRADYAAMRATMRREEAEAQSIRDLNGKPPELVSTRGLAPARAQLAQYYEWQHQEAKRRDDLIARRAELEAMIAAPAKTQQAIAEAVRQTATTLMGRAHASEKIDRAAMDAQLSSERHQAEAAQIALVEIEKQIETAELRCAHLDSRQDEFLNPALVEAADEVGLGKLYMKKIAELRAITDLLNGLAHVAGGFGSGFGQPQTVSFSKLGLPSIKDAPSAAYSILAEGNDRLWRELGRAFKMNPRTDASKFVSVPK